MSIPKAGRIGYHQTVLVLRRLTRVSDRSSTFIVTFLLASWQCWPLRAAQFGPVDDHRFALFHKGRLEVFLDGFRSAFESLVKIGRTPVFRPLTNIESGLAGVVFGITPTGVFTYIFLKYVVTLTLVGVLSRQLVALLAAPASMRFWIREGIVLSIVFAISSISAWQGIVPRTGPSELLLAVGLLLAASSALRISMLESPTKKDVALLFAGVIVGAGAKESGMTSVIFLVVAARPLVLMSAKSKSLRVVVKLGALVCTLFPIHTVLFSILGQPDIYGTKRTPLKVVQSLGERVTSHMSIVLILAVLVICGSVKSTFTHHRAVLVFIYALLLIWIMDGAIYELNSPNLRYRMVYEIIEVLLISSALVSGFVAHNQTLKQLIVGLGIFVFALNVVARPMSGVHTLREINQATADVTSSYWTHVEALARDVRGQQRPVVLFSFDAAASYEPIVALSAYLRYLNVDSPIGVYNAEPYDAVWNSPEWIAVQGLQDDDKWKLISPLDSIPSQGWICIGFSYTLDNPNGSLYGLINEKCSSVQRF